MSLAARVAKLEARHKQVLRCLWCRLSLRDVPPPVQNHSSIAPDSKLPTKCWFCGTKFVVPLRGLNEHQREAAALIYNSHPTKQFTDERVHAAGIWVRLYHSEVKRYEKSKQDQPDSERTGQSRYNPSCNRTRGSLSSKEEKAKRDRAELAQRAFEFHQAQTERFKKLANGPDTFPLDRALEEIENEYPTSGYDKTIDDFVESLGFEKYATSTSLLRSALALCNIHLQNLKKREACEVVIWGKLLPETQEEIRFFEKEKQREIDQAHNQQSEQPNGKDGKSGATANL